MAIRTSSAREVDALLLQLGSAVDVEREAAIARLRVIGGRTRNRVISLLGNPAADSGVRVAALKVLDALDDEGSRRAVMAATNDADPTVVVAAVQSLRPWITRDDGTSVLECVTALVADQTRQADIRRAALDALSDLPAHLTQPLVESVSAQLSAAPSLESAAAAGEWLASHEDATLGVLHDMLSQVRERERRASNAIERGNWLALRASVHAVLARRGSRIGLYDVREVFELQPPPLPLDLLVTMRTIGDLSCLEALARAWQAAADDVWWRDQLRQTASAIVARERATSRNAVLKRVRAKWPGFLA